MKNYLPTWSEIVPFAVLLTGLIVTRWSILDSPPTTELARGLWLEAAYLADTNFDLHRLRTEEPGPDKNGAYHYMASFCLSPI
ncbi:MAG: hypothetical protein U1D30_26360, partial [Planctomycetota bacterium]